MKLFLQTYPNRVHQVTPRKGRLVELLIVFILIFGGCATKPPKVAENLPSQLVLGLDGISYQLILKLQKKGLFKNFKYVSPMVASFPSISDPNWSRLMKSTLPRGYSKIYFDPEKNKHGEVRGSLFENITKKTDYEKKFDYSTDEGWETFKDFVFTEGRFENWLEEVERHFLTVNRDGTYFVFNLQTDMISHTGGEVEITENLAKVSEMLDRLQKSYFEKYRSDLDVLIVSDHGNFFGEFQMIEFSDELEERGWDLNDELEDEKSVVFAAPEIISFGAFFSSSEVSEKLASDLAQTKGIHVTLTFDDRGSLEEPKSKLHRVKVFSSKGRSEISIDPVNEIVDYHLVEGIDPFSQIELFEKGPLPFRKYFLISLEHEYPNALVRAWEGFTKNSQVPAQVLASGKKGWAFSNRLLKVATFFTGLESMHGSFHRDESLGVFMATKTQTRAITPDEFLSFVKPSKGKKENRLR